MTSLDPEVEAILRSIERRPIISESSTNEPMESEPLDVEQEED